MIKNLVVIILLLQINKIFSQTNHVVDFYVKVSIKNYTISELETLVKFKINNQNNTLLHIEKPFKNKAIGDFSAYNRLSFNTNNETELEKQLKQISIFTYVEKVHEFKFFSAPNDPKLNPDTLWHLYRVKANLTWDLTQGSDSVVIAIVDDNFEFTHPDLAPNVYVNPNEIAGDSIDNDNNGIVDDVNGADLSNNTGNPYTNDASFKHGTKVTGCAAAATNNGVGISSIGYNCKFLSVKCTNNPSTISHGLEAMHYAASMPAVKVVNISWGDVSGDNLAIMQQIIDSALYYKNNKIVFVVAAGNDGADVPSYPAACNNVIAVAGTTKTDAKVSSSSYGAWIDIAAPGYDIYTTKINGKYGRLSESGNVISGTSFSAPIVAGAVGLLYAVNKNLTFNEVLNCLTTTADDISAANATCNCPIGGRLNIHDAILCACNMDSNCTVALKEIADSIRNYEMIFSNNTLTFQSLQNKNVQVFIYDISGNLVFSKNCNSAETINLSALSASMYFAKAIVDGNVFIKKVIVEN